MSRKGMGNDDISALLYIVPFAVSALYALVSWARQGFSYFLPTGVFLDVTRSPYVFLVGFLAVLAGMVLEVRGTDVAHRRAKLGSLGNTLQTLAVTSLVLAIICAVYANGFTGISSAVSDIVVGRYVLVFPALLVLMSYLVTASFKFSSLGNRTAIALILLMLVPVSLREVGKHQIYAGLAGALVLIILGVGLFLLPSKGAEKKKED